MNEEYAVERFVRIPLTPVPATQQVLLPAPLTSGYSYQNAPTGGLRLRRLDIINNVNTNIVITLYDYGATPSGLNYIPVAMFTVPYTQAMASFTFEREHGYIFSTEVAASANISGVYISAIVELE